MLKIKLERFDFKTDERFYVNEVNKTTVLEFTVQYRDAPKLLNALAVALKGLPNVDKAQA